MISGLFILIVAVFAALLLFVAQMLRPVPGVEYSAARRRWWNGYRIGLVLLVLFGILCLVWGFLIEPNRLVIHRETIQIDEWPPELSGLRIAMIGDIHAGGWFIDEKKITRLVDSTNQLSPDLIVLLGDYMSPNSWHSRRVAPEVTASILRNLHAPLGVYAVLGNHDWWYNGPKVRRALEQNGLAVLDDDVIEVNWKEKSFWLVGLADLWTRPQHIEETLAKAPPATAVIALTHNPDIFPRLPQTVPLLLAAHTHGGQVNLPIVGTPIVPSRHGSKYTAGHIIENGHHLFVTTGIGTSIMPVRFGVPPEIVMLTIISRE